MNAAMFRSHISGYTLLKRSVIRYPSDSLSGGTAILKVGFVALLTLISHSVCATWQAPDALIVDGKEYSWGAEILEDYFSEENPKPIPMSDNSMCWRGYYATWELRDEKLLLLKLQDCMSGDDIWNKLLKGKTAPLLADWYTDVLLIPLDQNHQETKPYEGEKVYVLSKGIVERSYIIRHNVTVSKEKEHLPNESDQADKKLATRHWFDTQAITEGGFDPVVPGERFNIRGFFLDNYFHIPGGLGATPIKFKINPTVSVQLPKNGAAIEAEISYNRGSGYSLHSYQVLEEQAALDRDEIQTLHYSEEKFPTAGEKKADDSENK